MKRISSRESKVDFDNCFLPYLIYDPALSILAFGICLRQKQQEMRVQWKGKFHREIVHLVKCNVLGKSIRSSALRSQTTNC